MDKLFYINILLFYKVIENYNLIFSAKYIIIYI